MFLSQHPSFTKCPMRGFLPIYFSSSSPSMALQPVTNLDFVFYPCLLFCILFLLSPLFTFPELEDRSGEMGWVLDQLWLENVLPVADPMLMVPVPAAVPRLTCPDKANPLQQQLPLLVAGRLCVCWWASALPSLKKPVSASATGV